jgi:hypothetical protein
MCANLTWRLGQNSRRGLFRARDALRECRAEDGHECGYAPDGQGSTFPGQGDDRSEGARGRRRQRERDGKVFAKGLPSGHRRVITQAREAAVTPLGRDISPAMLWHFDEAGWNVLGYEYAPATPTTPPARPTLTGRSSSWTR